VKVDGRPTSSEVRDGAKVFDPDLVDTIKRKLDRVERETGVATRVETVESFQKLGIESPSQYADRAWGKEGLFILIDKEDRKFFLILTPKYRNLFDETRQQAVRSAFLDSFRKGRFDEGLKSGTDAIEANLTVAKKQGELRAGPTEPAAPADRSEKTSAPLVIRNQVRLSLGGARRLIAGAEAKAAAMNLKVNIAVVDDGGHLLAFERMDGARPASGYTAITKATTAATFRAETGPMPRGAAAPDTLLSLSLQNAAAASGGKLTTLPGGIPVLVDAQVIGGIGVGGGTGEQDVEIARAGIEAFRAELKPEG
jgi:glc operon protein GlcG